MLTVGVVPVFLKFAFDVIQVEFGGTAGIDVFTGNSEQLVGKDLHRVAQGHPGGHAVAYQASVGAWV